MGAWSGPIESGFGWHLVWIDELTPGRVPPFDEIEPEVKRAWLAERREELKRVAYQAMRERYTVVLPSEPAAADAAAAAGASAPAAASLTAAASAAAAAK